MIGFYILMGLVAVHPWPMFQKNVEHQGLASVNGPSTASVLWEFDLGATTSSSPVVAEDGTIYIGTSAGKLIAVTSGGKERWSFSAGLPINSAPVILKNGAICFGTSSGALIAVNSDGKERWRFQAAGQFASSSSPIECNGAVFVVSDDFLYSINPNNGKQNWSVKLAGSIDVTPAASGDNVYVQTWWPGPCYLYCYSQVGAKQWEGEVGGGSSSPTISNNQVFFGSNDFNLYSINTNGSLHFKRFMFSKITASPAIAPNGKILVGGWDSTFHCVNPDASEAWHFSTRGIIKSSAAVDASGNAYFGCCDSTLYSVSPDGKERWSFKAGHQIISSPAIGADGTIYIGCWDRKLYAIGPGSAIEEHIPAHNPDGGIDFTVKFRENVLSLRFSEPLVGKTQLKLIDITGRVITEEMLLSGTLTKDIYIQNVPRVVFVLLKNNYRSVAKKIVRL